MKYLFLLGLASFVAFLLYWRLRPYIRMARRLFGAVRDVRRINLPREGAAAAARHRGAGRTARSTEQLVSCASCGIWVPASRAVSLRASQNNYCSHECLERDADARSQNTRRSAS